MTKTTESALEQTAMAWLSSFGWTTVYGPDISPDQTLPGSTQQAQCEREDHKQVVLAKRLHNALERINPTIPDNAIDEAVRKLLRTESPSLIENNRRFHRYVTDGVDVSYMQDLPAPRPGLFFTYAILCDDESIYIGQTDDLKRRYDEHVHGIAAQHTKKHKPVELIHYEEFSTRDAAVLREKELKTGFGRKWLKREYKAGRTRQAGGREIHDKVWLFDLKELENNDCLLYTSPSPRDRTRSRMPSSA